ncbi:MAG: FAD-binding oxidoreductase [Lysobacterales bacterium]
MPNTLSNAFLEHLRQIFGADGQSIAAADCLSYGYDNSRQQALAQAVVWPGNAEQVQALVQLCRAERVALTARGRGTNTTGASVPVAGGVVVSFERMRRIIEIDPDNRAARVEPGVLNADLQAALAPHGLFWPPDPTSAAYSSIGGNLACNAGGPRAVKYGACRDNVLAVQAIAGNGDWLRCGARTSKGATGYDLVRLLVGSEGTLALITEATLKVVPLPAGRSSLRARYRTVDAAAAAVARIMRQPSTPSALEFMDATALRLAREVGGADLPAAGALLLIEVDGNPDTLAAAVAAVRHAAEGEGCDAVETADSAAAAEQLWSARKALSPALRQIAPEKINEDVVVPVSKLPDLVAAVQQISQRHGIAMVSFGHAGNGNLHVNLMFDPAVAAQAAAAPLALSELFDTVLALGGTLSGEHGIGLAKRPFMTRAIDPATLAMMRAIKHCFDPDAILNPGKLLP